MSDSDHVTVSENASVVRDPVTGEARQVIERTVTETRDSSWALWVAGVAVFAAALVLALVLLNRSNDQGGAEVIAAQAEAEAARVQAEQAVIDANRARIDATVSGIAAGNNASDAAAASAAAAEAAASRAAAAAAEARDAPVVVSTPAPEATGGSETPPQP